MDFYKGTTQGNQIFAETAVSMKTTITTNVDNWLASTPIKDNIKFLDDTFDDVVLGSPTRRFSRHNYMDYFISRNMFFKSQIKIMYNQKNPIE